jgi:predicted  nucleic acid-binding Zn-ribbon protein
MSQVEEIEFSEETETHDEKLVPVMESIRYRRRAQTAEKRAAELETALTQSRSLNEQLEKQVKAAQVEQELMRRLAAEGTKDLETAVLIAKSRLNGTADPDIDAVIEKLRREKQFLFAQRDAAAGGKTAGVRERGSGAPSQLDRAAKAAASTGRRSHLQEYLKLRRTAKHN